MDFNDDHEPSTARPAFKFQPKAKPRAPLLKKVITASSPSAPHQAADNQLVASPHSPAKAKVPNNDISDSVDTSNAGLLCRDTYSQWDPYGDYDDMYNTVEPEDYPSTMAVERDTAYFNYHSHMNKTPRVKWTKQDTELFYEGVQQFGSDLSLILHLFPGRTRQQLKLKYKKEERQQPVRLLDALTNRPKDLLHYKLVIKKLQEQIDLEEDQHMAEEEAFLATAGNEGNQEEGNGVDTQEQEQDEGSISEQNGDGSGETKVGSPAASYESDLDMGGWSPYRSTL